MTDSIESVDYPEKINGWVGFNNGTTADIEAIRSGFNSRYLFYMEYKIHIPEEPLLEHGIKKLHLDMMPAKSFTTICLGEFVDEGTEEEVSEAPFGNKEAGTTE